MNVFNFQLAMDIKKMQECISKNWKHIEKELKNYSSLLKMGLDHLSAIISYKTTKEGLKDVKPSADYEVFRVDPDIKLKFKYCLLGKIHLEETAIASIL